MERKQRLERKKIRRKTLFKSLLTLLIGIVIVVLLRKISIFGIETIEIVGNVKLSTDEVIRLSEIRFGDNLMALNKRKVIEKIRQHSYINSVNIKKKWRNVIIITIEERKPQAQIELKDGYAVIDGRFHLLETVLQKAELVTFRGLEEQVDMKDENMLQLFEELYGKEFLNSLFDFAYWNHISDIQIDEGKILIFLKDGTEIQFGDALESKYKFDYLAKTLKYIEDNEIKIRKIIWDKSQFRTIIMME